MPSGVLDDIQLTPELLAQSDLYLPGEPNKASDLADPILLEGLLK